MCPDERYNRAFARCGKRLEEELLKGNLGARWLRQCAGIARRLGEGEARAGGPAPQTAFVRFLLMWLRSYAGSGGRSVQGIASFAGATVPARQLSHRLQKGVKNRGIRSSRDP